MAEVDRHKQALENLERDISLRVRAGFDSTDEIAEDCARSIADLDEVDIEFLSSHAIRILADVLARQREEQKSWLLVTDFDRLQRAFDKLEATGIVCRHNFSCCGTCAAVEIWEEMDAEREAGRDIRGCAHYHMQDTESAVEGSGLYFSYGSVLEGDKEQEAVGHEIEGTMQREGLETEWNGSVQQRIHVKMDWKRRIPPK